MRSTNKAPWDCFYNGNNPLNLRSGYGNSDFDRTHVINFTYLYQLPKFASESSWKGRLADGWGVRASAIFQSGQPYSVIDYTGAVGSIFYGTSRRHHEPDRPAGSRLHAEECAHGRFGRFRYSGQSIRAALKASCFTLPLLAAGRAIWKPARFPRTIPYETNFVATGQRNIFRQSWQKRADISIVKNTKITERVVGEI